MDNAVKTSDPQTYALLRKWGIRYILGEHIKKFASGNLFLDGKLKRVYTRGRYEVFEVLGY